LIIHIETIKEKHQESKWKGTRKKYGLLVPIRGRIFLEDYSAITH